MGLFFTSDLHRFHSNVIKYCSRPFKDVVEMDEHILANLAELTDSDELYIIGDVSLNPKHAYDLPKHTKAKLHLIAGNHDACYNFHRKTTKMNKRQKFLESGWASVLQEDTLVIQGLSQPVLLNHYPYPTLYEKNHESRPKNDGLYLLHGHCHAIWRKRDNMIDVGYDGDYRFYSEKDIVNFIKDKRKFIPSTISKSYLKNLKEDDLKKLIEESQCL